MENTNIVENMVEDCAVTDVDNKETLATPEFDMEAFRWDNPFPEPVPDESLCTVYNGDGRSARDMLSDDTTPVFVFRREIWEEVQYLTQQSPASEFGLFIITKPFANNKPKQVAIDLYFPKQQGDSGGSRIESENVRDFYKTLSTHDFYAEHMHRQLAHLHSHNTMAVFWSAADDNQQLSREDLGYYDDWRFYLVVNTHNQVRCSFVLYTPLLKRIDNVPVVVIGEPVALTDERKAELDSWLRDRVEPLNGFNVFADIKHFDVGVTEEWLPKVPSWTSQPTWTAHDDNLFYDRYTARPVTFTDEDDYRRDIIIDEDFIYAKSILRNMVQYARDHYSKGTKISMRRARAEREQFYVNFYPVSYADDTYGTLVIHEMLQHSGGLKNVRALIAWYDDEVENTQIPGGVLDFVERFLYFAVSERNNIEMFAPFMQFVKFDK